MSEDQIQEKLDAEENKVFIIMGIMLALIWVVLIVIDLTGANVEGGIYFIYGILNIVAFLLAFRAKDKKSQDKWIKTNLFEDKEKVD